MQKLGDIIFKAKVLTNTISLLLSITATAYCQSKKDLYIPVTINSPLFAKAEEIQIGANINNYGFNYKVAGQLKNKIIIFSIHQNSGHIEFDPMNFNEYNERGEQEHKIQSKPSEMFYTELGLGYNIQYNSQKINLIAGVGRQFKNPNTRLFIQLDWGNEAKLINAGFSLRGNYTTVMEIDFFTIEPVIQGKFKIWNFRVLAQYGYSIAAKKHEDYMKAILTLGIEYLLGSSSHDNGYSN